MASGPVWVVEGEKKASWLIKLKFLATCWAHGAKSVAKTDWSPLAAFDCIIIWPDWDGGGLIAADEIARIQRSQNPKCKVQVVDPTAIAWVKPKGLGWDCADVIAAMIKSRELADEQIAMVLREQALAAAADYRPAFIVTKVEQILRDHGSELSDPEKAPLIRWLGEMEAAASAEPDVPPWEESDGAVGAAEVADAETSDGDNGDSQDGQAAESAKPKKKGKGKKVAADAASANGKRANGAKVSDSDLNPLSTLGPAGERPVITNVETEWPPRKKGVKPKPIKNRVEIDRIVEMVQCACARWPARLSSGGLLFVDEGGGEIRWLEKVDQLFSWLHRRGVVSWNSRGDTKGRIYVTKGELFSELSKDPSVKVFDNVEVVPHCPPLPRFYYAWKPPADYEAKGEHLSRLLGFFDNVETEADIALLLAAIVCPAWGGELGTRPGWFITAPDRQCGKSSVVDVAISGLYGDYINVKLTDKAEDELFSRLLTPASLTKRIVRIDNAKSTITSDNLEDLITGPYINGKRMFHGDASRPNTLVVYITANGVKLSRDMALRTYIINLVKPEIEKNRKWRDNLLAYIRKHRDKILADVIDLLKRDVPEYDGPVDRFPAFVTFCLHRCCQWLGQKTEDIMAATESRRAKYDEERDEAAELRMAMLKYLVDECHRNGFDDSGKPRSEVITGPQMVDIYYKTYNRKVNTKWMKSRMEMHELAGRLPGIRRVDDQYIRGYEVAAETIAEFSNADRPSEGEREQAVVEEIAGEEPDR